MRIRPEVTQYASVLVLSATMAVLVVYAYLQAHAEIAAVEQAQGFVDPLLRVGITLGFIVMVLGAGALTAASVWSAVKLVRALREKQS
jgi:hypothetical protein